MDENSIALIFAAAVAKYGPFFLSREEIESCETGVQVCMDMNTKEMQFAIYEEDSDGSTDSATE